MDSERIVTLTMSSNHYIRTYRDNSLVLTLHTMIRKKMPNLLMIKTYQKVQDVSLYFQTINKRAYTSFLASLVRSLRQLLFASSISERDLSDQRFQDSLGK